MMLSDKLHLNLFEGSSPQLPWILLVGSCGSSSVSSVTTGDYSSILWLIWVLWLECVASGERGGVCTNLFSLPWPIPRNIFAGIQSRPEWVLVRDTMSPCSTKLECEPNIFPFLEWEPNISPFVIRRDREEKVKPFIHKVLTNSFLPQLEETVQDYSSPMWFQSALCRVGIEGSTALPSRSVPQRSRVLTFTCGYYHPPNVVSLPSTAYEKLTFVYPVGTMADFKNNLYF